MSKEQGKETKMENLQIHPDRIAEIFAGKVILLTGVTGFVGKVLLEKLLRNCTEIKKIFVIIRPKYNSSSKERLEKIFKSPLFDTFKQSPLSSKQISQVFAIPGNFSQINLDLSQTDRELLISEVNMIYHCAALMRMDENLKSSVLMNVRGTRCILELAKSMKNLEMFGFVSTAYCQINEEIIYETEYDPPADPAKLVEICEKLSASDLSCFTHKILDNYPNTYCYTKALAEGLINQELNNLPLILLRPSLVIPALRDPIPGWTDTINGSIGFQIAAGKGLLRTYCADVTRYTDLVPVDIAVSAFLCAAFHYLRQPTNTKRKNIFNITTSHMHKVTWADIIQIGKDVILNSIPLNWVVWYPGGTVRANRFHHECFFFVQHLLPSMIVDGVLWLFNRPPILLPIYKRIKNGFELLKFYNSKQWYFDNTQSLEALKSLSTYEIQKYHLDNTDFDYREYFENCTLCARRYILHESDESLPRAKQHLKMMYYIDKIVVSLAIIWIFTILYKFW